MLVKERMTPVAHCCRPQELLTSAVRLMWEHDCGCVPVVVERNVLLGMVTDRDACMAGCMTGRSLYDVRVTEAMSKGVRSCGVHVIGPVPLGGRFWSAYFLDPFGTRLELATDRSGVRQGVVESVRQTEEEARTELATLFSDPAEVEKWVRHIMA